MERHPEAPAIEAHDTTPVTIEARDAVNAATALRLLARSTRRQATSRGMAGPRFAPHRRAYRDAADFYEAAARRIQAAADARFTA